jgi:hypothetical protein
MCPVSVNCSLLGGDFGRLRHVIGLVRPDPFRTDRGGEPWTGSSS